MSNCSQQPHRAICRLGAAEWLHFGRMSLVEELVPGLKRLGISRLRTGISWADYHRHGGKEWYDWLVPLLGREFDLLPCVTYTPPSLGIFPATSAPPRNPKDYADFLDTLITEYGKYFEYVELWNEPNNILDWDWRHDPSWTVFAEMITGAAHWMQRRSKKTVLGGMCPTDINWLRLMGDRGALDYIDVIGIHAFPGTWSQHFPGWEEEIRTVRTMLDQFGRDSAIWITECGYSTWRHDEARQLHEMLDALEAPADRLYWYSFKDLDPALPSQEGYHFDERHYHTGLVAYDGREKLAARLLAEGDFESLHRFAGTLASSYLKPGREPYVITGGSGFVGSNIADALASRGEDVLIVDNFSRAGSEENAEWLKQRHPHRIEFAAADLRDRHGLDHLFRGARGVLHLAGQVAVTTSTESPVHDFEINATGTINLLESMRRVCPEAPLLFASTNKVYGKLLDGDDLILTDHGWAPAEDRMRSGVTEAAPLDLHSPYGCSKGAADQYVSDYARTFNLRTVVLRMSCIYGPRQFGSEDQGWIAHFVRQSMTDKPITVYGDGHQVRDALYIDDAVSAWLSTLDQIDMTSGRVFNLGGGPSNAISLRCMLRLGEALTGKPPRIRYAEPRVGDQLWYVSNTVALTEAVGWRPRVSLEEGLTNLALWLDRRFGPSAGGPLARGAQA